jgi:hypothetical protein
MVRSPAWGSRGTVGREMVPAEKLALTIPGVIRFYRTTIDPNPFDTRGVGH